MGGLCVDCENPAGSPSVDTVAAAGADGIRQVAFDTPNFYRYCDEFRVSGFKVAVVLARESFPDDNYGAWAEHYALRVTPTYWLVGNEPDAGLLPVESPSSWSMRPTEYAALWHSCALAILGVQPEARIATAGLVSGQPAYAYEIATLLDPPAYAFTVHPYGRDAESARELLHLYQEALGGY